MISEVLVGGVMLTIVTGEEFNPSLPATLALQVHGRTRSKSDCVRFARYLQAEVPNLICATWDLPNHGSRLLDPDANEGWNKGNALHLVQMQAVIDQGAAEAVSILRNIQYVAPQYNIVQRVIIGVSLGGYVTWKVASEHAELLAAAVPIISSPDLLAVMRYRWKELEEKDPTVAEKCRAAALPEPLLAHLEASTRANDALRQTSLPILAICGGQDPLVPPQHTVDWGKQAAINQRVEVVPGVKHEVAREMIDLTAEYLYSLVSRI